MTARATRRAKPTNPDEIVTSLGSAREPIDALEEGAMRLNVVIEMLNRHDCSNNGHGEDEEDNGGYDLSVMRSAVRDVRDMMRAAVQADKAKQAAKTAGAQ